MNPERGSVESREGPSAELRIDYSREHDIDIVNKTVNELSWLQEQGYSYRLPARVEAAFQRGDTPSPEQVAEAVASEFRIEEYEEISNKIREEWVARKDDFLGKLRGLGLPLQSEYELRLTRYGTLGGYRPPNIVEANVHDADPRDMLATTFHETIHLVIENEIAARHVDDHWTKERIVDLIFGKFFPDRKELQQDPGHASEIDQIFEQNFPNIIQCIQEIAKLEKEKP